MPTYQMHTQIAVIAAGQYCQVINRWQVTDPTETNLFRLARDLADAMNAPAAGMTYLSLLANIMSEDCFVSSVRARCTGPPGAVYVRTFDAGDWPGAFNGNLAAQQVATYIKWMPDNNAGYHGGNFYPGVSEDAMDANRFTEAFKVAVLAFIDAHLVGIQGAEGLYMPTLHKTSGPGVGIYPVTKGQIAMTAGTMRRRLTPV